MASESEKIDEFYKARSARTPEKMKLSPEGKQLDKLLTEAEFLTSALFITQRLAPLGEDYAFKDQDEAAVQKYIKEKLNR
jgi:hypothetical protein